MLSLWAPCWGDLSKNGTHHTEPEEDENITACNVMLKRNWQALMVVVEFLIEIGRSKFHCEGINITKFYIEREKLYYQTS